MLGVPVTVERVELNASELIVAICRRGRDRQALPILDLPLPNPPPPNPPPPDDQVELVSGDTDVRAEDAVAAEPVVPRRNALAVVHAAMPP